jgi:hypothetical protein
MLLLPHYVSVDICQGLADVPGQESRTLNRAPLHGKAQEPNQKSCRELSMARAGQRMSSSFERGVAGRDFDLGRGAPSRGL